MTDKPQYIIVSGINGAGKAHINIINKAGSIISVVGKTTMEIMEPF